MLNRIMADVMLKTPVESEAGTVNSYDSTACPGDFLPDLETIMKTAHFFRDSGFRVWPYPHYLKIEATPQVFRQTLGASTIHEEDKLKIPGALQGTLVRVMFTSDMAVAS